MTTNQNVVKYLALTLAVFIIAVMISGVVWFVQGIFSFTDKKSLVTNTYDLDNYSSIYIYAGASDLTIETCNKSTLEITDDYTYTIEDSQLAVRLKNKKINYKKDSKIVLCTIDPIFNDIKITGGAGNIKISDIEANKVKFELGAGDVTIDNLTVLGAFNLRGGAGNINILNSYLTDSEIELGMGNFTANTTFKGYTDIDMGMGNLKIKLLDSADNYAYEIDKGLGSVKLFGETISKKELDTRIGTGKTVIVVNGGIGNIEIK